MTKIVIPAKVPTIPNYCFKDCSLLADVTLPSGLTSIGDFAFQNTSITNLDFLNEGLKTIGTYAFSGCAVDRILTFPSTLTSIGDYTFQGRTVTAIYLKSTGHVSLGNLFGRTSNCLVYTQSPSTATHENIPNVIEKYNNNWCTSLILYETWTFHCPEAFTAGKVTFTKQFNQRHYYDNEEAEKGKASLWYGLSLPFPVTKITTSDGRVFAPFNSGVEGPNPSGCAV